MDYVKDFQDSADKDKDEECGSKDKDLVFVDKNHSGKDIQNGPQGFSRPQGLSSKTTLAHTHTTHTHRYVQSKTVLRNVEAKLKETTSPAGVLSGTSGRHKATQECISAILNEPVSCSLLSGLHSNISTARWSRLPLSATYPHDT